ncbi:MAG: cytochrome B [Bacteroidia bacterium]|nr:cytochrome B [Bacteroidia bacterium]NNC86603.1 cytochrome B [Bacteroidia bacterium]
MLHAHSGLRWLVLFFLVLVIVKSVSGWLGKKEFNKSDNLLAVLLLVFTHVQLLVGLGVYFMNGWVNLFSDMGSTMKDATLRFWTVEHLVIMLIAVALITVGRVISKKADTDVLKHKKGAMYYIIALLLILWAGVFKPYALGRGWI